uniref:Uncharacterized protein n=1 Tax=Pseudo-nitzschia australis TaxID=44445 RepID=A0A7S4AHI3_9STRA
MKNKDENENEATSDNDDNFDGLSAFFSSFQLALVLFVLPSSNILEHNNSNACSKNNTNAITILEQLNDVNSHFHRAQRLAAKEEQQQQQQQQQRQQENRSKLVPRRRSNPVSAPSTTPLQDLQYGCGRLRSGCPGQNNRNRWRGRSARNK